MYKRQGHDRALHQQRVKIAGRKLVEHKTHGVIAVSYTHLDVYKRQPLNIVYTRTADRPLDNNLFFSVSQNHFAVCVIAPGDILSLIHI